MLKILSILPNNKTSFLAAQSAAEVVDVNAAVVDNAVPQGFTKLACAILVKVSKRTLKL